MSGQPPRVWKKEWPMQPGNGWELQKIVINNSELMVKEFWVEKAMKAMKAMKTMKAMKAPKNPKKAVKAPKKAMNKQ